MRTRVPLAAAAIGLVLGCGPAPSWAAGTAGSTTVRDGNVRFEFLTPSLVRMEYSPSGAFVDAPTAVVQKRSWPSVPLEQSHKDGWLIATTSAMTLRYREGTGSFGATNLEVTWKDGADRAHVWHPGEVDRENLGGLTYSLDNVATANLPALEREFGSPVDDVIPGIDVLLARAKPGLLSRSGYAFIDDSETPVVNARGTWIEPRASANGQDWYLFTYDRDYRKVLEEYAELCGPIPMIPRFVLGPSITDLNFEYFPGTLESEQPEFRRYNQQHLVDEVAQLRRNHIPLDMLVLDFAWHNYGWQGGYDWSPLIPHPDELSRWLHERGVRLSLNDHPGYANTDESILSFSDSHAPEVLKALGRPLPPKASFDRDVSRLWSFAADPRDEGLRQHWYVPGSAGGHWQPIRIGPWEAQGHKAYRGVGWYRASVRLPTKVPQALYLYLGQVEQSYRIFINGREATHSRAHWPRRLTYTDISPLVAAGRDNHIVLRVEPAATRNEQGSGILRGPVAIREVTPPERIYFDLSDQKQAEVFMSDLHGPLMRQGVDVWWVDGGSGSVDMPGLNKQLWTNKVFYDYSQEESGKRAFILARYGDWGSERYPGFFTGDTYSQWPVLAYEVAFSARGGNVLVPYISHDIGGFHGARIDFDLYARWIEFGTFSAILRMHSAHENPREDNVRMPWVYGERGIRLMRKYFMLREQLIPYLYTYTWLAHTEALPLLRPLYLEYPQLEEAYRHADEYFLGSGLLVAPVLSSSGERTVWLPPGDWLDFFTGKRYPGDRSFSEHYAVDETPVFVREGAIIPEQGVSEYSDAKPLDRLIVNVYGAGNGKFDLYEDDGVSLDYAQGQQAHTPITHTRSGDGVDHLVLGPTAGNFKGQPPERAYELRIRAAREPSAIRVEGKSAAPWSWDAKHGIAVVVVPKRPIGEPVHVDWQ